MTVRLYVSTDSAGVQRVGGAEVSWSLPSGASPGAVTTPPPGSSLLLRDTTALLDELGERIYVVEAVEAVGAVGAVGGPVPSPGTVRSGVLEASAARILSETAWNTEAAARFALDCAEHVLGDAADAVLPGGETLGEVVRDARSVLERSSPAAEERLGTLALLWAVRRLRRHGAQLGDLAFGTFAEDRQADLDALDDPAWTTVATARDAVLGAVEALRHVALPRHVAAEEATYDAGAGRDDTPATPSAPIVTPWGTVTFGAEHHRGFEPAWVAARDTATRARDAARDRGGDKAESAERSFQAGRLEQLLARTSG